MCFVYKFPSSMVLYHLKLSLFMKIKIFMHYFCNLKFLVRSWVWGAGKRGDGGEPFLAAAGTRNRSVPQERYQNILFLLMLSLYIKQLYYESLFAQITKFWTLSKARQEINRSAFSRPSCKRSPPLDDVSTIKSFSYGPKFSAWFFFYNSYIPTNYFEPWT